MNKRERLFTVAVGAVVWCLFLLPIVAMVRENAMINEAQEKFEAQQRQHQQEMDKLVRAYRRMQSCK